MERHRDHPVRGVVVAVVGGAVGLVVSVIVVLNLHILAGLKEGYAASPGEVWNHSVILALADITLLVGGAVFGFVMVWRLSGGSHQPGHSG